MASKHVYLWGFSSDSLSSWPEDLIPTDLSTPDWPTSAPVIVHGNGADEFLELAEEYPLEDGRLPDAVLYLPKGIRASVAMQSDFDATVKAGDWAALRELLTCPQQFLMAEMADKLPASFVWGLSKPVEALTPRELPLSPDVTKHLATCGTCWDAFKKSLAGRHRLQRRLLCPLTERLAAYVRGTPNAQVERHLQLCVGCRTQVAVLKSLLVPNPWLKIALNFIAKVQEQGAQIRDTLTTLNTLTTLIGGTLQQGLAPAEIKGAARGQAEAEELEEPEQLAANLAEELEEDAIMLSQSEPRRDMTFDLEDDETLWIGDLYGSGMGDDKDFRVEVWRGNELLFESSKGKDERGVLVPLEKLLEAMRDSGQLIIKAKEESV